MPSLDERFQAAVSVIQKLPKDGPVQNSNETKLKFYGYFKQATVGNVNTERPGIFALIEKKKWDAWKEVEGLSSDEAKEKYIEVFLESFDKAEQDGVDVAGWLNGPDLDPSIKDLFAVVSKK